MSRLPSSTDEVKKDLIDEDIPTLDLQHVKKSQAAPVMFLSQSSAPMLTPTEMVKAQNQDPYCRDLQLMVGSEPTWLLNKNGLLCRRSTVNGSI